MPSKKIIANIFRDGTVYYCKNIARCGNYETGISDSQQFPTASSIIDDVKLVQKLALGISTISVMY